MATLADGRALVARVKVAPGEFAGYTDSEISALVQCRPHVPGRGFVVDTILGGYLWRPSAMATADGKVMVTWESGDGLGERGIVLDPDMPGMSADFSLTVGEIDSFNTTAPDVTALSDSRFFAVWSSNDGMDGGTYEVQGWFFDVSGTAFGTPVLLNTTSPGDQINSGVTELSDGRILVTFVSSFDGASNGGSIRARVIKPDGSLQEEEFKVNTTTVGYQAAVDVTALSGGRAVAVWFALGPIVPDDTGGNPNVSPGEIRAQVIGADGQPEGLDFVVNATDLSFNYAYSAVTTLAHRAELLVGIRVMTATANGAICGGG
ncbi:MAG: hypothetical protein H7245_10930 [Candidatus Saccharibacteria bacterium]|nr:hypothetical protein [Pseudorhodobacter sp.]